MTSITPHSSNRTFGSLPASIAVAEFTLTVAAIDGEETAALFRERLQSAFLRLSPLLGLVYELDIEEIDVWTGSRKSRNRAKLNRKKVQKKKGIAGFLAAAAGTAITFVGLAATDYSQIEKNFEAAVKAVERQFSEEGRVATVEEVKICVRPSDQKDEEPKNEDQ